MPTLAVMGDRYTLTASKEVLSKRLGVDVPGHYQPRYNAAPTQLLPLVTPGSKGLSFFYWGQIPGRAHNRSLSTKLLYSEAETIKNKPIQLTTLMERRCLVPADGFYTWKRISKKGKVAHRIVFGHNEIVTLGGIWEEFEDDSGTVAHTFRIITTPANSLVAPMHPTMPLVLNKNAESTWSNPASTKEDLLALLDPYPENDMHSYSVSPKIDDVTNDSPALIQPFAPADQFGNYSLFD